MHSQKKAVLLRTKKYMTLKRILVIVLCSLCVQVLCAQEMLVLPYDATGLTDEQKAMNPERLAYPTELKESIKSEVSFECNTETGDLGPFSVSATTKVMFSPGNLQYQASTKTWRFAEHQWEVIGEDNQNISDSYSGWIDLFGWGTGNNPTLLSTDNNDFSSFTDWGINAISNGGNEANMWRTLTKDEWWYLMHDRPNAAILFGLGSIENEMNGIILLPDKWELPTGASFTPSTTQGLEDTGTIYSNSEGTNFTHNIYTKEEWSVMEAAGAVFLPAACYRSCDGFLYYCGWYGDYWSSTLKPNERAWALAFSSSLVDMYDYVRCYGLSVRLVR